MSIFQPTSSFIIADMKSLRLEIQLAPVMQLYIVASTEEKGKMSGEFIKTLNVCNFFLHRCLTANFYGLKSTRFRCYGLG